MSPLFIAVAGGSGSGKTTFAENLHEHFGDKCVILSLDNYYKPKISQKLDRNGIENFDLPESFDEASIKKDLEMLSEGKSILLNRYNYNQSDVPKYQFSIDPKEIIIIEGLFALYFKSVLDYSSFNVFIKSNLDTSFKRRLERDKIERGYGEDDVTYRFYQHAIDSYLTYIHPSQKNADLVVSNVHSIDLLKEKAKETAYNISNFFKSNHKYDSF